MYENTHLVAHSRRGWALALEKWLKDNVPAEAAAEQPEPDTTEPQTIEVVQIDGDAARSASAVQAASLAEKRKESRKVRAETRFHYQNSDTGKQRREEEAKEARAAEDQEKLDDYDEMKAAVDALKLERTTLA